MDNNLLIKMLDDMYKKQDKCEESYDGVFEVMDMVLGLANSARREGLLALEETVEGLLFKKGEKLVWNIGDEWPRELIGWKRFLCRIIMLIIEGTEPELIEKIMYINYMTNNYKGREALKCVAIMLGCEMIQQGEIMRAIEAKLVALLPEEEEDRYRKRQYIKK